MSKARLLGGEEFDLSKLEDTRQPLMDWLRDKNNGYFASSFVNRVWASYFSVGIVAPTDDFNLANPPSNKALLDHLTEGFIQSGFDMKWVHREIANSRTYQLSWATTRVPAVQSRLCGTVRSSRTCLPRSMSSSSCRRCGHEDWACTG